MLNLYLYNMRPGGSVNTLLCHDAVSLYDGLPHCGALSLYEAHLLVISSRSIVSNKRSRHCSHS